MIIVAFDIGSKNLAWSSVFYKDLVLSEETNKSKIITESIQELIKTKMNVLNMDVFDIEQDSKNCMTMYKNLHDYLSKNMFIWSSADVFLVEQQMSTRSISNIKAIKISQHILAFFMIHYQEKKIVEYCANYKTSVFGIRIPEKKNRKKWSIEKVQEIIQEDPVSEDYLSVFPKKDDICDCILMTYTYFYIHKIRSF
jgi:hypothetical protein